MDSLGESEIDGVLRDNGYGFLGLASDNRPYVIPMSFGYNGDALYFQMSTQGRKMEFMEENPVAAFTVLGIDHETGISKSVLVEGELSKVLEDNRMVAFEALAANAEFGTDVEVWSTPVRETDLSQFELRPTDITGRIFGEKMA